MERKAGEIFEIGGVFYRVAVETYMCNGCDLKGDLCEKKRHIIGECQSANRKEDGVIFVKIKDMETRNVKLSLEKAKEFYAKGGEFRDLALSAFTEEELTKKALPKTWEEYMNNWAEKKEGFDFDTMTKVEIDTPKVSDDIISAHNKLIALHLLRDCYRQGWEPDYTDREVKYSIIFVYDNIHIYTNIDENKFLTFQSLKIADEFLNNFRDLIKQAGDLI